MKHLLLILIFFIFTSCRTTRVVSEDKTNREAVRTEYRDRLRIDSVFLMQRDSIMIRQRADTVFVEKFHTQIAYRDRLRVDTVSVTDTVSVEKTVVDTVFETTNELTGWQWFQVWIGRIMIALIVIYMAYKRIAGTFKM